MCYTGSPPIFFFPFLFLLCLLILFLQATARWGGGQPARRHGEGAVQGAPAAGRGRGGGGLGADGARRRPAGGGHPASRDAGAGTGEARPAGADLGWRRARARPAWGGDGRGELGGSETAQPSARATGAATRRAGGGRGRGARGSRQWRQTRPLPGAVGNGRADGTEQAGADARTVPGGADVSPGAGRVEAEVDAGKASWAEQLAGTRSRAATRELGAELPRSRQFWATEANNPAHPRQVTRVAEIKRADPPR